MADEIQELKDEVRKQNEALQKVTQRMEREAKKVEELSRQVSELNEHVEKLTEQVHAQTQENEALRQANEALQNTVDRISKSVEDMHKDVQEYYHELPQELRENEHIKEMHNKITEHIEKVENTMYKDQLTQLNNRTYMNRTLENSEGTYVGMTVDIDHFKRFNDTYGHDRGDEVLKNVSNTIKETCDKHQDREVHVVRSGGEEVNVLVKVRNDERSTPLNETQYVKDLAEEIRKNIEARGECTVSIGVSDSTIKLPQDPANVKTFDAFGDKNLYEAKENGRNQVVCHDKDLYRDIQQAREQAQKQEEMKDSQKEFREFLDKSKAMVEEINRKDSEANQEMATIKDAVDRETNPEKKAELVQKASERSRELEDDRQKRQQALEELERHCPAPIRQDRSSAESAKELSELSQKITEEKDPAKKQMLTERYNEVQRENREQFIKELDKYEKTHEKTQSQDKTKEGQGKESGSSKDRSTENAKTEGKGGRSR